MKPLKKRDLKDFEAEIVKAKKRYITEAMEFRRRILEQKQRTVSLRKKKNLRVKYSA